MHDHPVHQILNDIGRVGILLPQPCFIGKGYQRPQIGAQAVPVVYRRSDDGTVTAMHGPPAVFIEVLSFITCSIKHIRVPFLPRRWTCGLATIRERTVRFQTLRNSHRDERCREHADGGHTGTVAARCVLAAARATEPMRLRRIFPTRYNALGKVEPCLEPFCLSY